MENLIYMKRALELAKRGEGHTAPNPLVGAVIVKDGEIIGEGWHAKYGGPHAEINAIQNLTQSAEGATLYVTLEPCAHYGKTPPCVDAIISHRFAKVIVAMLDPNPLVRGKGVEKLESEGIEVLTGMLEAEASEINEPFLKFITTRLPFCVMKTAMTLDGKLASTTGDSKWISNDASRRFVHQLRNKYSAIMVGIGTVLADDPALTTRFNEGVDAHRIIVDTEAKIPLNAAVLHLTDSSAMTLIATTERAPQEKRNALEALGATVLVLPIKNGQVNLNSLMQRLGELNIDSVLVEGGAELNFSMLQEGLIDRLFSFISPKIIGGKNAKTPVGGEGIPMMCDAIKLERVRVEMIEGDILVTARVMKEGTCLQD